MSQPVVIDRSCTSWVPVDAIQYPQGTNDYPFWALLESHEGERRFAYVVMTENDGLCETADVYGESYTDQVVERVVAWMPANIPLLPRINDPGCLQEDIVATAKEQIACFERPSRSVITALIAELEAARARVKELDNRVE